MRLLNLIWVAPVLVIGAVFAAVILGWIIGFIGFVLWMLASIIGVIL